MFIECLPPSKYISRIDFSPLSFYSLVQDNIIFPDYYSNFLTSSFIYTLNPL